MLNTKEKTATSTSRLGSAIVYGLVQSPLGKIVATMAPKDQLVTGIYLLNQVTEPMLTESWIQKDDAILQVKTQLEEYFAGVRLQFDLPLAEPEGTQFQVRVWSELRKIPYGTTVSYGEIARRIGIAGASRAVGTANSRNPLSIVVPCHRVIASDGSTAGYAGGIKAKQWLLEHESRFAK